MCKENLNFYAGSILKKVGGGLINYTFYVEYLILN